MKERIKKVDQAWETAPQKSHTGRRSETNGKPTEKNNKPKVPKKQFPFVKHQENAKWYDYQINERLGADDSTLPTEKFKEIFDEAHMLLQNDVYLYNQLMRSQGGSEAAWLQTVVSKGTSGDRMTAMQLQITKSPVHGISFISELVRQCEKQNIRQSMETMPLLEKILIDELLPETRKLISFEMRPLARLNEIASGSEQGRKRILVLWMFEHELKKIYASFIKSLELLANGAVETAILRSVKIISNLLAERPEAEAQLLTSLVNKLGHPNYKVGARIAHLLEGVCARQPAMKQVVVTEVERLVYRKNINDRGHLYAATFLSQLPFSRHDPELAVQVLSIYFGLFKTLVARKKTEPRLLRILLTASNRAFPFAKAKAESLVSDIDTLYKLMHTSTFTVSLQTLKLLFQVLELSDSFSDRYYSALYRKLFDQVPAKMFRQFLSLLFKTMKADTMETRVRAMVKRLLQVAVNDSAPFAAGILVLVSKLAEERPNVIMLKRLSSMAELQSPKSAATAVNEDDDEEIYVDLDDEGKPIKPIKSEIVKKEGENDVKPDKDKLQKAGGGKNGQGWVHKNNQAHRGAISIYSSEARNPLFVAANDYVDTELVLLSKHYHPSIAIFANNILKGKAIRYNGDPLEDFTSIRFLDRFVYKNPKDRKAITSTKIIRRKVYDPWGVKKLKIASREYLMKKQEEIPADERFLHRFATLKFQPKEADKTKDEDWDEIGSVNSEEMDRLLERLEPGEANDEFDIDFKNEFSVEKKRKEKPQKRKAEESDGEDDDLLEDGLSEDEDGGDEDDVEDEDEDDWDDEDVEMEGDESDEEDDGGLFSRKTSKKKGGMDDESDDEDFGDADAFVSADRFAEMLEEGGEDEVNKKIRKKIKKPKGFKKRR